MKKTNLPIQKMVERNRAGLAKQDAWARNTEAKNVTWMDRLTIEELSYGEGERQKLDLIYREKWAKKPLLIYIHGGGFIAGSKEARRTYCGLFADHGFLVANLEYSLAPEAPYPHAIGEIAQAIDFILDHAEAYGIDTNRITVAGESAGGYYAMFAAELGKDKTLLTKLGLPEMRHMEYDVKACLLNCPCTDIKLTATSGFPDAGLMTRAFVGASLEEIKAGDLDVELAQKSPLTYVTADFPPCFLIYGQFDQLRFNALALAGRLREKGVRHRLYKSTGIFYGQHTTTMIFKGKKAFDCFDAILAFLNDVFPGQKDAAPRKDNAE